MSAAIVSRGFWGAPSSGSSTTTQAAKLEAVLAQSSFVGEIGKTRLASVVGSTRLIGFLGPEVL